MQVSGHVRRRDWILIGSLVVAVSAGWVAVYFLLLRGGAGTADVQANAASAAQPAVVQPAAAEPAPQQSSQAVATQAAVVEAPAASRPVDVSSRDARLLEALQQAQQLKEQGRPQDALNQLQHALQEPGSADGAAGGDVSVNDLLGLLAGAQGGSGQAGSGQTGAGSGDDTAALLGAALQMLQGTSSDVSAFMEDLERDMGIRPKGGERQWGGEGGERPRDRSEPAPRPQADVIARVYNQPIDRSQVESGLPRGPSPESRARLTQMILDPLLEMYCKQMGIEVVPADLSAYQQAMRRQGRGGSLDPATPDGQVNRQIAERMIRTWKLSRSLYEFYGGTVILTSTSRLEPVGAYEAFLKEQRAKGAFQIDDAAYREAFWGYFQQDFGDAAVPGRQVDFTRPW